MKLFKEKRRRDTTSTLVVIDVIAGAVIGTPPLMMMTPTALAQSDRTFQSEEDGFRLQISQGWVIQDTDNIPIEQTGAQSLAMLCLENEALPGIGGEANCEATNSDFISISRWPDLQSMPQFQNESDNSSNIIPTTNDLVALFIQNLQSSGGQQIKIENTTDVDEFTKLSI